MGRPIVIGFMIGLLLLAITWPAPPAPAPVNHIQQIDLNEMRMEIEAQRIIVRNLQQRLDAMVKDQAHGNKAREVP